MSTNRTRWLLQIWAALVAATCVSWALGSRHGAAEAADVATALALGIAFVKVRFVGTEFMELRDAPLALRLVFDAWVVVVGAALTGVYLVG